MREVLVRGEGVSRTFGAGDGAVTAVAEATFEIDAGAVVALVGPSGSGKSTLLHLIAALDEPTGGLIEWPALGPREDLRPVRISFAFQGQSLLPPLTVEENVALPLLLNGVQEDEATERARALLGTFDLAALASKLPEELSGGQSQRVSLARALVGRPRLILADEPTGQQDRASGRRVVQAVLDIVNEIGAALLVATHDLTVADRLLRRWTMTDGRLETEVAARSR